MQGKLLQFDMALAKRFLKAWVSNDQTDDLDQIATGRTTVAPDGTELELFAQVSVRYGRFLHTLVGMFQPKDVLEIGMANGISSAYIAQAHNRYHGEGGSHVIIDPFQSTDWQNAGRALLSRLKLDHNIDVIEDLSIVAVPVLERQGRQFDFVFIDGNHCLDYTLADVLTADRVLRVGGLIVLDDSTDFGVKMAVPYLDRYRTNLKRVCFDNPLVHWLREHVSKRRRHTVYQKVSEDKRGPDGF